jgi:hypothetical protein
MVLPLKAEPLQKIQQNAFNPTSDKSEIMIIRHLRRAVPKWENSLFRSEKAPSIKQADLRDMFKRPPRASVHQLLWSWPHLILRQVLQQ